ncbi:MAG: hypothetical protein Q8N99_01140 [Nanoarchaeota archaeon]|nr:hypothetical protein [Nanoarchaeota archaeon]
MSDKKCILCNETMDEEHGKLKGTIVKVLNEKKKTEFIYICPSCQKQENWIEKAKIKGA